MTDDYIDRQADTQAIRQNGPVYKQADGSIGSYEAPDGETHRVFDSFVICWTGWLMNLFSVDIVCLIDGLTLETKKECQRTAWWREGVGTAWMHDRQLSIILYIADLYQANRNLVLNMFPWDVHLFIRYSFFVFCLIVRRTIITAITMIWNKRYIWKG